MTEDAVPEGEPGLGPGPVRRQVQHGSALRLRDPGRDVDDGAAQGRAPGNSLGGAGHRAGSTEHVVGDRRAYCPGAVRGEPARRQVRQGSVDQVGEHGLDDRVPAVGDVGGRGGFGAGFRRLSCDSFFGSCRHLLRRFLLFRRFFDAAMPHGGQDAIEVGDRRTHPFCLRVLGLQYQ